MSDLRTADVVIIGGGISGIMLRIKREWQKVHPGSVLLKRQQDEEDDEGEEDSEGEEDGEGEQDEEGDVDEELNDEEAALAAETEALERENAAEDEAMARLEEERSLFVEQDRKEDEEQGGSGK